MRVFVCVCAYVCGDSKMNGEKRALNQMYRFALNPLTISIELYMNEMYFVWILLVLSAECSALLWALLFSRSLTGKLKRLFPR